MKKVVVTGSSGFIGRHLLPLLHQRGYEVFPIRLDLTDPSTTQHQLKQIQPDGLIHLAWETTHGLFWHSPSNLEWQRATLSLIESFALFGGKRAIFAGTCAEKDPVTLYGASKESVRLTAQAFLKQQNVSFAWGRIFSPYGPYEKPARLIPSLINSLLKNQEFKCCSPSHVRDFLYVEDVAAAFIALLESSMEGTFDIGSGHPLQLGDFAQMIANILKKPDLISFDTQQHSDSNPTELIANPKPLFEEVGFKPQFTLREGISQTIDWWQTTESERFCEVSCIQ